MLKQFADLFNTEQLQAIYSTIPPKIIYQKMDEIKSILKNSIEKQVGRDVYKDILVKTSKIKSACSRKKSDNNVMIPIDVLEQCLPKEIIGNNSNLTQKNKFVNKFFETLKSKIDLIKFKEHDEYQRISGWLVGRLPQLKGSGDGTVIFFFCVSEIHF